MVTFSIVSTLFLYVYLALDGFSDGESRIKNRPIQYREQLLMFFVVTAQFVLSVWLDDSHDISIVSLVLIAMLSRWWVHDLTYNWKTMNPWWYIGFTSDFDLAVRTFAIDFLDWVVTKLGFKVQSATMYHDDSAYEMRRLIFTRLFFTAILAALIFIFK